MSAVDDLLRVFAVPPHMTGPPPEPRDRYEAAEHRLVYYRAFGIEPPDEDADAWTVKVAWKHWESGMVDEARALIAPLQRASTSNHSEPLADGHGRRKDADES